MILREFPDLGPALNAESWEYLATYQPLIAEAIKAEVRAGATPAEIRRFVISLTGRIPIADRCEQAASHAATIINGN